MDLQERQDLEDQKRREDREASIDNLPPPPELSNSTENLLIQEEPLPPPPAADDTEQPVRANGSVPPPPLPLDQNGFIPPPPPFPPDDSAVPPPPPVGAERPKPPPPPVRRNSQLSRKDSTGTPRQDSLTSLDYQDLQNAINEIDNIDPDYTKQPPVLPPPPTIPAPPLPPDVEMSQQAKQKLAMKQNLTISVPDNANQNKLQVQSQQANVEALSPQMKKKLSTLLSGPEETEENIIPNGGTPLTPPTPMSPVSEGGVEFGETYDMLEYAEKYFNDHPKEISGTLMKSLKKKTATEVGSPNVSCSPSL